MSTRSLRFAVTALVTVALTALATLTAPVAAQTGRVVVASFGGAWEFRPSGDGGTAVSFRYQFRTRPRWLGWLLEPLARRWFSWETRKRVLGLQAALPR